MTPAKLRSRSAPTVGRWDLEAGETSEPPLPAKPEGMGWRDYLIMLLHLGAELEHSLMVQYLYAAYSLNDRAGTARQRQKVAQWRDLILTVAKEEMGHLLTVQNLLCLLGGPVCFDRSHFPTDTRYLPFEFRLEPISPKTLAWYVYAEAPAQWQTLLRAHSRKRRERIREDVRKIAELIGPQVVKGHTHTVGQLYDRILEIISDPELIPDSDFRADTYPHQASWDDWGRGYAPPPARPGETEPPKVATAERSNILILPMATRTEAMAALREIGGQGEVAHLKLTDGEESSHFDRFLELFEEFVRHEDHGDMIHKVPVNPTALTPAERPRHSKSVSITQKTSLLWARLFNYRYRALLSYLAHTFRLARLVDARQPNVRGAVMHKIFGEMYNLKTIAGILVRRPLKNSTVPDPTAHRAAPPFDLPYTIELPLDETDCWRRHQEVLQSCLEIGGTLLTLEDPKAPKLTVEEQKYLRTLKQLDEKSIAWMQVIIDGLSRHGGQGQ